MAGFNFYIDLTGKNVRTGHVRNVLTVLRITPSNAYNFQHSTYAALVWRRFARVSTKNSC